MNSENQLRLFKFRDENPDIIISLIYSSALLCDSAILELNNFCERYNIISIDFNTTLFELLETENDIALYEFASHYTFHCAIS